MKKNCSLLASLLLLVLCFCTMSMNVEAKNQTRIHFICIEGNNDAILLESNGHFGMVDSGEDTDYPTGADPRYPFRAGIVTSKGNEREVIRYLKKLGVKKLDFYIGTHVHSDHIGSGDEILNAFKTKRLYLDKYRDSYISNSNNLWDNLYCYDTLMSAAKRRGTRIIQNFSKPSNRVFTLGDMKIEIMNYNHAKDSKGNFRPRADANSFSLGVKVSANGHTAFLGSDINNFAPDYCEDKLMSQIGSVDILKLNHHGVGGSSSSDFLRTLCPDATVVTGKIMNIAGATKDLLDRLGTALYTTNGQPSNSAVIADMTNESKPVLMKDPGKLTLKNKRGSKKQSFYTPSNKLYGNANTWFYYNQKYYFISSDKTILKNRWRQEGNDWYYLGYNGAMVTSSIRIGGIVYSFDSSGRLSKGGWTRGTNAWSYALPDGRALTGWKLLTGKWYYFDESGNQETGWVISQGKQYYLNSKGEMVKNRWIRFEGCRYYFGKDGIMLRNTRKKIGGKVYRFDESGICLNK